MRGKRIAAGAAVVFGIALALALLEAAVRVAGLAPPLPTQYGHNVPDDQLINTRRPGARIEGRAESGEFTFRYDHNSLGFRDVEHSEAKPPQTLRIVALGDSFTYGIGADFPDTYLVRLEALLNARPAAERRVEIIKLGLPRQFPRIERLTLERVGLRFDPDIVMVAVLPNDVVDSQEPADACVSSTGYLVPCWALALDELAVRIAVHSDLARLVFRTLGGSTHVAPNDWPKVFGDNGPFESGWRAVEQELGRMAELARQHGAAFVVVAIPQAPPWPDAHDYAETRLATWSATHGAVFVPTLPALRAAQSAGPLYWPRDGHCRPAGYAVVAAAVASVLEAHGLAR